MIDDPNEAARERLRILRQDETFRRASLAIVDDAPLIESCIAMLRAAHNRAREAGSNGGTRP